MKQYRLRAPLTEAIQYIPPTVENPGNLREIQDAGIYVEPVGDWGDECDTCGYGGRDLFLYHGKSRDSSDREVLHTYEYIVKNSQGRWMAWSTSEFEIWYEEVA